MNRGANKGAGHGRLPPPPGNPQAVSAKRSGALPTAVCQHKQDTEISRGIQTSVIRLTPSTCKCKLHEEGGDKEAHPKPQTNTLHDTGANSSVVMFCCLELVFILDELHHETVTGPCGIPGLFHFVDHIDDCASLRSNDVCHDESCGARDGGVAVHHHLAPTMEALVDFY